MPPRLHYRAALLPLCIALVSVRCAEDTPPTGADPTPPLPPAIARFLAPETPVSPGDLITYDAYFHDTIRVKRMILDIENAFLMADTFDFDPPKVMGGVRFQVPVPIHATLGERAATTLTVVERTGRTMSARVSALIKDLRAPSPRLTFRSIRPDQTIGTGDTLIAHVYASDNYRLVHMGYDVDGRRDSVAADGLGDSHDFRITIPSAWRETRPRLTAWARDAAGNLSGAGADNAADVPVYDWVERPVQVTPIDGYPFPADMLWDAKRAAAYILRFDGDGTGEKSDIVRVTSGGAQTLVSLPQQALVFTFSGTGDSLIVAIPTLNALGIVDLRQPVPSLTLLSLQHQLGAHWWPLGAQVSGKHLFVSLVANFDQTRLLDIDLATGTQVIRSDLDGSPEAPPRSSLLRLADGRLFICAESPSAYFQLRFLYSPTSNSFTPTARLRAATPWQFSASPSGRFMLGDAVFDAALDSVAVVTSRDWYPGVQRSAALSADGTAAYLATWYGYEKRRLSDGALLEQVKLGAGSNFLVAAPDGNALIVLGAWAGTTSGEFALRVVDLR